MIEFVKSLRWWIQNEGLHYFTFYVANKMPERKFTQVLFFEKDFLHLQMVTMTSPTYFSFSQNFSSKLQSSIDIHHYDSLAESKLHLKPRILVTYQNLSYLRPFLFLIQEMYDFWENHSFVLYLREKSTPDCTETSITRKSPHHKLKLLRRSLSDWLEK